ncbi:MAG: competence/damage-inducible protein A [Zoogloeaceae bacterium]|jgi:molybdopterin-biosynthesis enzyme MoeA-like protein|nr:competence/damage-inducible protein A [Zoogloeaceae bacterium]
MKKNRVFGAVIIGDEILSGKREDAHFAAIAALLAARGLRLSWVSYLGDDRARLAEAFRRSMAAGDVVFSCGGIGNTPDDHTRQAATDALGVGLERSPEARAELEARFIGELGGELTEARQQLGAFPAGAKIIPNPINRVPGFMVKEHYFVPGFPQMAHPMIEWALDTFYRPFFRQNPLVEKAFLLSGENAHESGLLPLMEHVVAAYPDLRLFSLPSLNGKERRHLELGVEGEAAEVDSAMEKIREAVTALGIDWEWRN